MRDEKKTIRQQQIEKAAYEVLESKGYGGTSMQGIAKRARASNETLYNWYGDKKGLFQALVTRNAAEVKSHLEAELKTDKDALSILSSLGPKLLGLLTGDRAVALNRAAAADPIGRIGGDDLGLGARGGSAPSGPGSGTRQIRRSACLRRHRRSGRPVPRSSDR